MFFRADACNTYFILNFKEVMKTYVQLVIVRHTLKKKRTHTHTQNTRVLEAGFPSCESTGNIFSFFGFLIFVAGSYLFNLMYFRVWSCHSLAYKPSLSLHHLQEKAQLLRVTYAAFQDFARPILHGSPTHTRCSNWNKYLSISGLYYVLLFLYAFVHTVLHRRCPVA